MKWVGLILFQILIRSAVAGELPQGRYIGTIELEPDKKTLAVVSEFYLESPEDLTKFPTLHASMKLTLGGYNGVEYVNEIFPNVRYDFDNGVLTLDDPNNDLVITGAAHPVGSSTEIVGNVFVRSSALFGKIYLLYETDEPGEESPSSTVKPNVHSLTGQYEGKCGSDIAVFQLQAVRGLKTIWQSELETSSLSRYYGIAGRLGVKSSQVCGTLAPGIWCTQFNYGGGSYNFYNGKLILKGQSATDECLVNGKQLSCEIRRTGWNRKCEFAKVSSTIQEAKFFPRLFNLSATAEQLKELPPADPPKNKELSDALRGTFKGYLHNETNNIYQYVQLNVMPFSFTENPHNPNQIMISSTATLHLGKDASSPYVTQRFEPRSFYIRPGFTLNGPNTDTFINITEWKKGFIRGVFHSHAFGKVGTIQLVKGDPGTPPSTAEFVRSFQGEYEGPIDSNGFSASQRWFRFLFPAQPNDLTDHLIRFSGSYNPVMGVSANRNIDRAIFDPFTGALGWIVEREGAETFSTGFVGKDGNMRLFWPPAPNVFGALMTDYIPETFQRRGSP